MKYIIVIAPPFLLILHIIALKDVRFFYNVFCGIILPFSKISCAKTRCELIVVIKIFIRLQVIHCCNLGV